MRDVLKFLVTYEIWGYGLLGLIAIVFIQKFINAFSELRSAVYGLEREAAQRKISSIITVLGLLGLICVAIFSLVTFVAPVYPWDGQLPTPTMNILATAIPTQGALPAVTTATVLIPAATKELSTGCIPNQIEWTFPKSGDSIKGIVELKGTVSVPNLGFYKYEYSQTGSSTWITIAAGSVAIIDQPLGGSWNTSQVIPGNYQLRLVVADNENNLMPVCVIPIKITAP